MSRSPESEIRSAAALILADAIDKLELAQVLVCPEPRPAQSAAEQAHARACLGVADVFHLLLAKMHETSGHGSPETLH